MTNEKRQPRQSSRHGNRRRKHIRIAAAVVVLLPVAVCVLLLLRDRRSADERLAEIEVARAVPDAHNAACIYNELLQDPRATPLSDSRPSVLNDGQLFYHKRTEPWRTRDCPQLAAWIEQCAPVLDKLLEASQIDACRFPISIDLVIDQHTSDRRIAMRQWAFLLMFALNNDLAEGRLEAALTKWRCIIQMGNHLRQQPLLMDHLVANATVRLAFKSMVRFVVTGDPSARHLQEIEVMPLPLADDWKQHLKQIRLIDRLVTRKMKEPFSLWDRLRYPIVSYRMERAMKQPFNQAFNLQESPAESNGRYYRENIATARGLRILVALRRYRDDTGHWPASLDEISSSLPETMLTDPLNAGSFVYRRTAEAFELYSKGLNDIDDHGRSDPNGPDDVPIWIPPRPSLEERLRETYGDRYRGVLYDQNNSKQQDPNDVQPEEWINQLSGKAEP
jgi:hypothetical protein